MFAIGMLSGYCGTLSTPMAANINIVPVALLELKSDDAVIRQQVPTAVPLWACNVALMYFLTLQKEHRMTRVLVTAFEPFGGETVNPSQQAVQRLAAGAPPVGVELSTASLPVVFGQAIEAMRAAVAAHDPAVVLCLGEAGGRVAVTPERFAVNLNDAPFPDNAGRRPVDEPVVADGPVAYASTLPIAEMVAAMRAAGIPAAKSSTAGNYVCNNVFYGLMHLIATERPELIGGFVHVPYMHEQVLHRPDAQPSLSIEQITEAVLIAVKTSAAAAGARRRIQ